jgi:hypothetical protein
MTVMIEPDTRGIDALSGQLDDNLLEPLLFHQLTAEMGQQLADAPWPQQLPVFDNEPWQQLPTIEQLGYLWSSPDEVLSEMIHHLGIVAHGEGPDLPQFMAAQRQLAEWELELKRAREADDAAGSEAVDDRGSGEDAAVGVAVAGGGGGDFPGGPEDGDSVGEGREAVVGPDTGKAQKVPRKRRAGKAASG